MGFVFAAFAVIYAFIRVIIYACTGNVPEGWTSLIVFISFFSGLILISNGILGIYIGYIFNEVKRRPLYIVRSVLNPHDEQADEIGKGRKELYQ